MAALGLVANLVIVGGYCLVPFLWLPYLRLTGLVFWSGVLFFLTCAITHLSMAFGFEHSAALVLNHVIQAAAVLTFILGFGDQLRRAENLLRHPGGHGEPTEPPPPH